MDEVRQLAQAGRPDEGIRLVQQRADGGDSEAMLILANWRFWGLYGPRSVEECHEWLERSAAAGSTDAALLRANLINNGTGRAPDPDLARSILESLRASVPKAAEQLDLIASMPAPLPDGWAVRSLSEDPPIRLAERFFSAGECDYVRRLAEPAMQPSMIFDPATGRPIPHPVRRSSSANFGPLDEDLVIHALNGRIAAITGTDPAAGEPMHVLRYTPGQEFRLHHDAIAGESNQREWTAIVYLNDDYQGGQTQFPKLGIEVAGRKGDCLIFRNTTGTNEQHDCAWHAGLPVTAGAKWVASRWIRMRPYEPEVAPVR